MNRLTQLAFISFSMVCLAAMDARAQLSFDVSSILVSDTLSARQQQQTGRILSGIIITQKLEVVLGVTVLAQSISGEQTTTSDSTGFFHLSMPDEMVTLKFSGRNIAPLMRVVGPNEASENLQIKVEFLIPPIHENVVIVASELDPAIERRNDEIYKNTLCSRDDQVFQTLNAGINAGLRSPP